MENENICVFCGEKLSRFRSTTIPCGHTLQPACKSCEKELAGLEELELCQRALLRGLADQPERVRARIDLLTTAEDHRHKCLRCGGKLRYKSVQSLDNSPYRDTLLKEPFEVQPAYCVSCGKYEFFEPTVVRKNKHLAYLIWKDTHE